MSTSAPHLTPQQQRREQLCAALIAAISHQSPLHFRHHRLHQNEQALSIHAAHVQLNPEQDSWENLRGISDGLALRLIHSDPALHQQLMPHDELAQVIFELLEQLRCEALVSPTFPGMVKNVQQQFTHWSLQFHYAGFTEHALGLLLYTLAQIVWARLNNCPVLEATADLIEATRAGITPLIGKALHGLKHSLHHQADYAQHALFIAEQLQQLLLQEQQIHLNTHKKTHHNDEITKKLLLLLNISASEKENSISVSSGENKTLAPTAPPYRIFTQQYDRIIQPNQFIRPALLRELRRQLDEAIQQQGIHFYALVRQLRHIFTEPERDEWRFAETEGYLDGRYLSQLVTSPDEQHIFKQVADPPKSHASVCFLLDCSGSMKTHAQAIAMLLDTFSHALEQAGIAHEILGFTTQSWNGGRPLAEWRKQGKPAQPGRLNETCHIIYKAQNTPWRRARPSLAALLKTDIYKEGVDGEAVEWACERLWQQTVKRRLLVVISDGCPMDSATQMANERDYLDQHLRQVIHQQQQQGIEMLGLGVGLDLDMYYSKHLAIDLSDGLNQRLFYDIMHKFHKK